MTDRELMQQALHTLEGWANHGEWVWPESALEQAKRNTTESIAALRERLAQPEQEPVAWMHNYIEDNVITHRPADLDRYPDRWDALYETPPPCQTCQALARTVMMDQTSHDVFRNQWQGLTDEEISKLIDNEIGFNSCWGPEEQFARAVEAKLKEKNT